MLSEAQMPNVILTLSEAKDQDLAAASHYDLGKILTPAAQDDI